MKIEIKSYSTSKSLLSSIFTFLIGAILFTNPTAVEDFISYVVGGILVVVGIIKLISYLKNSKINIDYPTKKLYSSLFYIILVFILILFTDILAALIRYILGAWILFFGINRLISAIKMKMDRKGVILLILSMVLIVLGLYVMLVRNLFIDTMGLMLMIYSGIDILGYIFYSSNTMTKETPKEGETTLITPEKIEIVEKKTKKEKKETKKKSKK